MSVQTENMGNEERDERAETIELGRKLGFFEGKTIEEGQAAEPVKKPDAARAQDAAPQQNGDKLAAETPKPVVEPFKGFADLPKESQDYIKSLQTREQEASTNYTRMLGRVPAMQREMENLRKQSAKPQSEQRTADVAKSLKKFEEYQQRFPEDAEAIKELLESIKDEVKPSKELPDKIAQLEQRLNERESRDAAQIVAKETTARLSKDHPDWEQIAGWKDDSGNPVPQHEQKWHPWFNAWLSDQLPEIRADYEAKLGSTNAAHISHIFTLFKRDAQHAVDANGETASNPSTDAGSTTAQRRAEALQDPSPRPSRSGAERTSNPFMPESSDAERRREALAFYDQFRAGKLQT
jgi:hypothetical protein